MEARAVVFDFNGTLSNDEPILFEIFRELFEAHGKPLSAQEYFDRLCGLSDPEIVRTWLGPDHPAVDEVVRERIARYQAAVADGSTVEESTREALRYIAERVPVGIVSGAARAEVESVLRAASLADAITFVVAAEDVENGKPHPEGYLLALELLDADLRPAQVVVFEDTEAGIASAKAAGMTVVAVTGTLAPERLREADEQIDRVTIDGARRYLP
jgi:beta-phosphoglucomutase-like phosphatase (HAD superfamily)